MEATRSDSYLAAVNNPGHGAPPTSPALVPQSDSGPAPAPRRHPLEQWRWWDLRHWIVLAFFLWMSPYLRLGAARELSAADFPPRPNHDRTERMTA